MSLVEEQFAWQIKMARLPAPERELVFHPKRRWRFDFAWTEHKFAVEIDGGTWANGRHTRGAGFASDCEKKAEALLLGWRVLSFPSDWVKSGKALRYTELALSMASK